MTGDRAPDDKSVRDAASTTRLTVDLDAMIHNWRAMAWLAGGGVDCAAVVKADAYGLGADRVVPALARVGCRTFFVATVAEGSWVRRDAPDAAIYVLDGVFPGAERAFIADRLQPVISSLAQAEIWSACASSSGAPRPALHIDTGMTRLGLSASEFAALEMERLHPALLMSHLACADDASNPKNESQRRAFEMLRARMPDVPASLANSAGILLGSDFRFDMVRPGIALYGGQASAIGENPVEPVAIFEGRIAQVRNAAPGDTVGYGAMTTIRRPSRLAVVAAGYADGYMRSAGSSDSRDGAVAYVAGQPAPVMGRVSMDLIVLDVTDLPEGAAREGGWAELIGPNARLENLAEAAGTISYEILTGLGRRATRVYLGG